MRESPTTHIGQVSGFIFALLSLATSQKGKPRRIALRGLYEEEMSLRQRYLPGGAKRRSATMRQAMRKKAVRKAAMPVVCGTMPVAMRGSSPMVQIAKRMRMVAMMISVVLVFIAV